MLAVKRSAGVALEVNVRNSLRGGDKTQKQGYPLWLWNQEVDVTRSPKQGNQWPHRKDSCPA